MITNIQNYIHFRKKNMRGAWSKANMNAVVLGISKALAFACLIAVIYVLGIKHATAEQEAEDNRIAAKISNMQGEINALRDIVKTCLTDRPLKIGDEWFICNTISIGRIHGH